MKESSEVANEFLLVWLNAPPRMMTFGMNGEQPIMLLSSLLHHSKGGSAVAELGLSRKHPKTSLERSSDSVRGGSYITTLAQDGRHQSQPDGDLYASEQAEHRRHRKTDQGWICQADPVHDRCRNLYQCRNP